jgi:hypothetical protein
LEIVTSPKKELTKRRINAKELAFLADWRNLAENYYKAHSLAIERNKNI